MAMRHGSGIFGKLESFIRKYYKNQIIKGVLLSVSLLLSFYLIFVCLEYFGKYSSSIRLALLVSYLVLGVGIIGRFIFVPLLALWKLKKRMSYEVASKIIGDHFSEVKDKLTNVLQLDKLSDKDNSLILASIEQKTTELKPIDFKGAIDYKRNQKYLRFLVPVFLVFIALWLLYPALISIGTKRIVQYNKVFKEAFPFTVIIDDPLVGVVGEDYELRFRLEGEHIPEKVFVEFNNKRYKAEGLSKTEFRFVFNNVRSDVNFDIVTDGRTYDNYDLKAISKPQITGIELVTKYPGYLGMKDEVIVNPSDVTLPEGTKLVWRVKTEFCSEVVLVRNDSTKSVLGKSNDYSTSFKVYNSEVLSFVAKGNNETNRTVDSVYTGINVIPDLYPSISVMEQKDSVFLSYLEFNGEIKDDYGLRSLKFHYELEKDGKEMEPVDVFIPIRGNLLSQGFRFPFDTKMLNMEPGDRLNYYFEVFDNDGVNGSKSTRTPLRMFAIPTEEEIRDGIESRNEDIKEDLSDSHEMSNELNEDIDDLKKSLLQKKNLSWDDKKKFSDLLDKQKELKDKVDDLKQKNEINDIQKNELNEDEERILDKEKRMNDLFNELEDDDLKKLMDEMEKLMDKMDRNKMLDMLDKMEISNDDLEKELDRTLELFKQMQMENKVNEALEKIEDILKEQEDFLKDAKDGKNNDDLKKQQNDIGDKMDQLKEDLDKLKEINEGMENKQDLGKLDSLMNEMEGDLNDSKNELDKNKKGKSQKSMGSSKSNTKKMKDELEGMQSEMQSGQSGENLEDLRQLLDNTLKLSFDQEKLIEDARSLNINNPQFKNILKEQRKLIDDSKIIEDSLLALSKRVIQIESMVNKEISTVKNSMQKSLEMLEDRNKSGSIDKQHYALTSLNNLALMLSEAIEQMQKQMQQQNQQSAGNKSCNKPGQGSKPMEGLLQRQMGLQQKLEDLKGRMDGKGKQSGKDGEISKDLVKLANEQESIRNGLQELSKDLQGDQKRQINDIIKKMEENEYDILNKRISSGTVKRNEDITIKLMDSEKALRNQDQDEKRKSNEGVDKIGNNSKLIEDYFRKKSMELEIIRTIPPVMRPYYKSKTSQYLNNF